MKALVKITIAVTLFFIGNMQLKAQKNIAIEGSGNLITTTVLTKPYDHIYVHGSMEIFLEKGKEGTIQISAEDNVQEHILVESDGDRLTISMKNNISLRNTHKIKIKVPFEVLSELTMIGSGKIEGKDVLKNDSYKINLQGSGEVELNIETNVLTAELNGSGEMKIFGKTKYSDIKTTGSGDFEGRKLISETIQIYSIGSGTSSIFATNSLSGKIQGSGSIFYGGNPTNNEVEVNGSGKVSPI